MSPHTPATATPYTDEQKAEINAQLGRLLENSHFSHSRRFPSFLKFIIQEELEGRGDLLKERTLGVEVFGRDSSYDTTADPIVRVTAAEIRKRIAQYYLEEEHPNELRISLPSGSYVPHFIWNRSVVATAGLAQVSEPASESTASPLISPSRMISANAPPADLSAGRSLFKTGAFLTWLILLIAVLVFGGMSWTRSRPSALDHFWNPVLVGSDEVVVCFPRTQIDTITLRNAANPEETHTFQEQTSALMSDDLQPLASLAGLLEIRHQRYTLVGQDAATLTDLRRGPTIFLGAFDSVWTLRETRGLRYRFGNDAEMKHFWIEDTQSPARWQIDRKQQIATNNYRDYAIVARFVDGSTGHVAVVSAGIARGGTVAAGEFLTESANMETIKSHAPKNWPGQNMEFVLSTEIIDGRSAPPKIEATYFW